MDQLLIFLVFLIATIIYTIALEKLLKNPLLVASIIFVSFLIVSVLNMSYLYLIYTFIYAIVSYLTAVIICILRKINRDSLNINSNLTTEESNVIDSNQDNNVNNSYNCMNYLCRRNFYKNKY